MTSSQSPIGPAPNKGHQATGPARDSQLVRAVAEGDDHAFRQLFLSYGPVAKALALRVVRQAFMAEEIVQEVFLALWRDPAAYSEQRGSFRSWLMSAVHHRAVDAVRHEEAHRRRAQLEPVTQEQDIGESFAEDDQAARTRAVLRASLERIPQEQRQVLESMYFEGKTQARIAEDLGVPLGTVKSRTLLGMRRLRAMLPEIAS